MGVWIRGVWNGYLESPINIYLSEAEICRKMTENLQRARITKFQAPKIEVAEPEKHAISHPQSIPPLDSLPMS